MNTYHCELRECDIYTENGPMATQYSIVVCSRDAEVVGRAVLLGESTEEIIEAATRSETEWD